MSKRKEKKKYKNREGERKEQNLKKVKSFNTNS
jgi:hypothetical protein